MFPGLITHLTQGDMKCGKLEIDQGKFSNRHGFSRDPNLKEPRTSGTVISSVIGSAKRNRTMRSESAIMSRGVDHNSERVFIMRKRGAKNPI